MRRGMLVVALAAGLLGNPSVWAATYEIDPSHSTVEFKIRHLLSYVRGTFNEFAGTFDYDPAHPEQWKAGATIQAGSIDTRVGQRDEHLRSKDFFEVETYPTIIFTGAKVTDATPTSAKLHGTLTMHGVEKPVVLDVAILGSVKDQRGQTRAGFSATTTVNRKDFGLTWNKALETGQLVVGEDVEIILEIEAVEQP